MKQDKRNLVTKGLSELVYNIRRGRGQDSKLFSVSDITFKSVSVINPCSKIYQFACARNFGYFLFRWKSLRQTFYLMFFLFWTVQLFFFLIKVSEKNYKYIFYLNKTASTNTKLKPNHSKTTPKLKISDLRQFVLKFVFFSLKM